MSRNMLIVSFDSSSTIETRAVVSIHNVQNFGPKFLKIKFEKVYFLFKSFSVLIIPSI
jgi:hypothetical protein